MVFVDLFWVEKLHYLPTFFIMTEKQHFNLHLASHFVFMTKKIIKTYLL